MVLGVVCQIGRLSGYGELLGLFAGILGEGGALFTDCFPALRYYT